MFLKQYSFKPRQTSNSSYTSTDSNMSQSDSADAGAKGTSSSHNSLPGATKGGTSATPTPANNVDGKQRRKSSTSTPFAGLNGHKRGADSDMKRAEFMEQKPGSTGPIQNAWNNIMHGSSGGSAT